MMRSERLHEQAAAEFLITKAYHDHRRLLAEEIRLHGEASIEMATCLLDLPSSQNASRTCKNNCPFQQPHGRQTTSLPKGRCDLLREDLCAHLLTKTASCADAALQTPVKRLLTFATDRAIARLRRSSYLVSAHRAPLQ